MQNQQQSPAHWWGDFRFEPGVSQQWHIGPLTLVIRCQNGDWQVGYDRLDDSDTDETGWNISNTDQLPASLKEFARYIFRDTSSQLSLSPLLADRPVISRPHTPFNLTAGEEATLYVSSPLWISMAVGTSRKILGEIGIQRPSDTWFGPSTREGELCYASTTHCRLNLDELPLRAHRAITPLVIRNQADSTLLVERLNLPVPLLPLYIATDGRLWTPKITLTREKDGDMAALKIDSRPPIEAPGTTKLCNPRKTASGSVLIRAFNAVFS